MVNRNSIRSHGCCSSSVTMKTGSERPWNARWDSLSPRLPRFARLCTAPCCPSTYSPDNLFWLYAYLLRVIRPLFSFEHYKIAVPRLLGAVREPPSVWGNRQSFTDFGQHRRDIGRLPGRERIEAERTRNPRGR